MSTSLRIIMVIGLMHIMWSCADKAVFQTSRITPAATGKVVSKEGKNGNFSIEIEVQHLADPGKLKPSRKYYVVWNRCKEGKINIGKLSLDKELNGSLKTESAYKVRRILISAEDDDKASKPGKQLVLKSAKL